jgi:hypothetical protein
MTGLPADSYQALVGTKIYYVVQPDLKLVGLADLIAVGVPDIGFLIPAGTIKWFVWTVNNNLTKY